jgi:hypothetical protein
MEMDGWIGSVNSTFRTSRLGGDEQKMMVSSSRIKTFRILFSERISSSAPSRFDILTACSRSRPGWRRDGTSFEAESCSSMHSKRKAMFEDDQAHVVKQEQLA